MLVLFGWYLTDYYENIKRISHAVNVSVIWFRLLHLTKANNIPENFVVKGKPLFTLTCFCDFFSFRPLYFRPDISFTTQEESLR